MRIPRVVSLCCLVCLSLACRTVTTHEIVRNPESDAAARQAVLDFFRDFNAADVDALRKDMNFPHIILGNNGRASITQTAEDFSMNFDAMRSGQGWDRSTIDSLDVLQSGDDRVHFAIRFSRYNAEGERYLSSPGLWIVTNSNGHWGLQLRSYLGTERLTAQ